MLAEINVRRAVLSVAGVNEKGYYNSNLLLVETERAMMNAADTVIVVADSTKFGQSSLARLSGLGEIDTMVVDNEVTPEWQERIRGSGVDVIVASGKE
jgi:DeoR/GlpR family transcriptional regulator of sugar metabolism